jgi:hypothetical protein
MQAAAALIRRKNHGVSSCRAILFRTACNCAALLRLRLNRHLFPALAARKLNPAASSGCYSKQKGKPMNTEQRTEPQGRLLLRTMAMPTDTNPNGDIFGGWLMSQMDIAGGILAYETAYGRAATVAADKIVFHRPVSVGDVVACYGELIKIGNTSMQIHIEVWVHSASFDSLNEQRLVTEALFTYVAIDKDGQPRPVPQL